MLWRKRKVTGSELPDSRVRLTFHQHLLPFIAGCMAFLSVFGFFNSGLLTSKVVYVLHTRTVRKNLPEQTTAQPVDQQAPPLLIVRKLNLAVPVVFGTSADTNSFETAFQHGTVHYPHTALPGKLGNVVIFGQSSGQWWAPGKFKFVFTLLDKLDYGDQVDVDYHGEQYVYRVYNRLAVDADDTDILNQGGNHMLTLFTCTPIGTNDKRLAIQAEQIIPGVPAGTAFTQPAALPIGVTAHSTLPCNTSFWGDFGRLVSTLLNPDNVPPVLPNTIDVTKLTKDYDLNKRP